MIEHFENIEILYGNASVQIPNNIFKILSSSIKAKNNKTNIQQSSFAYAYLVAVSFLYKYSNFVDIDNCTYIQNADIKELLGYNRNTKSIDRIIKDNGVLDILKLTETTKDYPIGFTILEDEKINDIPVRRFVTVSNSESDSEIVRIVRSVVKNKNYKVKEPLFLTTGMFEDNFGTLYDYEQTHSINIREFIFFLKNSELDNIDFTMYGYLKSKCKGFKMNTRSISLNKISTEVGVDEYTFYKHLRLLKEIGFVKVKHKGWQACLSKAESNEYIWIDLFSKR